MGRFDAAGHGNSAAIDVHARLIAIAALGTKAGETALGRLSGSPGASDAAEWAAPGTSEQTLHACEQEPSKRESQACMEQAARYMARWERRLAIWDGRNVALRKCAGGRVPWAT